MLLVSVNYLYPMQDPVVNVPETETVFNQWLSLPIMEALRPRCETCTTNRSCRTCESCSTLYFNCDVNRRNSRGHVFCHPLSNFYSQAEDSELKFLRIDGNSYMTSEHYFQAERCRALDDVFSLVTAREIIQAVSPGKAWMIGKDYADQVPGEKQVFIMKKALSAKFTQNQHLKEFLLKTGNAFLVYRADLDPIFGDGIDGRGGNLVGILLMQLRAILRERAVSLPPA